MTYALDCLKVNPINGFERVPDSLLCQEWLKLVKPSINFLLVNPCLVKLIFQSRLYQGV